MKPPSLIYLKKRLARYLLAIAGAIALGTTQAHADSYFAADIFSAETKITDRTGLPPNISGTADSGGLRLRLGAQLTPFPWLDAEAQLGFAGKSTFSESGGKNEVSEGFFGIFAKPKVSAGPIKVYGLVGVAAVSYDISGVATGKASKSGLAYGAGIEYALNNFWGISLDYMQYPKVNLTVRNASGGLDAELRNMIALGVVRRF